MGQSKVLGWMQKGFICFFIQQHLGPFYLTSVTWNALEL